MRLLKPIRVLRNVMLGALLRDDILDRVKAAQLLDQSGACTI
jgi:hypothetical protein